MSNNQLLGHFSDYFNACISAKEKEQIGLELECEGLKLPNPISYWEVHSEGSLKPKSPYSAKEYVLMNPMNYSKALTALEYLSDSFKQSGTLLNESNRTSVHVHFNASMFTYKDLAQILCAYYLIEDVLIAYCGEERVGNLFALSATDSSKIVTNVKRMFESISTSKKFYIVLEQIFSDQYRYAALNLSAIKKLGSIEFRAMRMPVIEKHYDNTTIKIWTNILYNLVTKALSYQTPDTMLNELSKLSYDSLLYTLVGPHAADLLALNIPHKHMINRGFIISNSISSVCNWPEEKESPHQKASQAKLDKKYLKVKVDKKKAQVPPPLPPAYNLSTDPHGPILTSSTSASINELYQWVVSSQPLTFSLNEITDEDDDD